jgi:cell fate (sporulation/competence/biofilm development) regulator YlbF (YheA/YmcA/DUF963 family)
MDEKIRVAAEAFGKVLLGSPVMQEYRQSEAAAASDVDAVQLEAELMAMYDGLVQRQSAGEILSGGEIDAYYNLEREVRNHPLLMKRDRSREALKDYFSEAHGLLSDALGLNFKDIIS